MDNENLRVNDVDSAHEQAFDEDFGRSMEAGKVPAKMKQLNSNMAELQSQMNEMSESIKSYESNIPTSESIESSVPPQEALEAEESLTDAPDSDNSTDNDVVDNEQKKPGLFSRGLKRITSPFKKAQAFVQTTKQNYLQNQIDRQQYKVDIKQAKLDREQKLLEQEQARMEEFLARQLEKEAAKQAFKQSIVDSGRSIKKTVQNGFQKVGDFARGIADKGRAIPIAANRVALDVKDGWTESKSFASDVKERGREGIENVKESATARRNPTAPSPDEQMSPDEQIISMMASRLKEKHMERDSFNDVMKDIYGKDIGYNKLVPSDVQGSNSANQIAYLESNDYITSSGDNYTLEKNPHYYQHMMDLHSEDMLAQSNGQLEDIDYEDRAKMLYEIMMEDKGETQSKKELNQVLMESYGSPYPSKRLHIFLTKNPSLTGIDDGLTDATVDNDRSVSNEYNLSTDDSNIHEADEYKINEGVEVARQQDINKEHNDVDLPHEGHIDLNQEQSNIVQLEEYRQSKKGFKSSSNKKEQSDPLVASGKVTPSDKDLLKDAFRAENSHKNKALTESKNPVIDVGDLNGPDGP